MKPDIHPNYRPVVFQDPSADFAFLTKSTIVTEETIDWEDGNTYPLAKVEISSASHPFFTGTMRIIDTAGRVERFERRFGRRRGTEGEAAESPSAESPAAESPAAESPAPEQPVEEPVAEAAPVEAEVPTEDAPAEDVAAETAPSDEAVATDEG